MIVRKSQRGLLALCSYLNDTVLKFIKMASMSWDVGVFYFCSFKTDISLLFKAGLKPVMAPVRLVRPVANSGAGLNQGRPYNRPQC